jgi:hypothetical protein
MSTIDHLCGLVVKSSWLQMQRYWIRFPGLPDFLKVVGLERGPFSLVSTTEELLGRKRSSTGLENPDYGCRGSAALTTRHPSIHKSWH